MINKYLTLEGIPTPIVSILIFWASNCALRISCFVSQEIIVLHIQTQLTHIVEVIDIIHEKRIKSDDLGD